MRSGASGGSKLSENTLDGREWREFPVVNRVSSLEAVPGS